jgi:ABC-type polysaccharide/polyol phosphate transport system ATPase subunit
MIDLRFSQVSKQYRIRQEREAGGHLLTRALGRLRRRSGAFWALRDVSFEVRRGEALGIIGPNGAGKSTVLKLLSKITAPTAGEISIRGRLSALIEVGSGFHPELTGRENVYLSGSILGMRRRDITRQLDSIVDFAEVRQFIDTPVKRYSSGMYVRLGFSIAAHLHPDILLLDEVLAVGDAAFQAKCFKRIRELRESGTTIVFISHDLSAVARICDRALLLMGGQIVAGGPPRGVIAEYQRLSSGFVQSDVTLSGEAHITAVGILDGEGREATTVRTGQPITIRLEYAAREPVEDAAFEVFLHSPDWAQYAHLTTALSGELIRLQSGVGVVEFSAAELGLQPGAYRVSVSIIRRGQPPGSGIDYREKFTTLIVEQGKAVRGSFYMPHEWRLTSDREAGVTSYLGSSIKTAELKSCNPHDRVREARLQ